MLLTRRKIMVKRGKMKKLTEKCQGIGRKMEEITKDESYTKEYQGKNKEKSEKCWNMTSLKNTIRGPRSAHSSR